MRFIKYITVLIILLAFSQCKKEHRYPDDPKKSKKTPQERLTGSWQISEYTLNGTSIIDTLNSLHGYDIREQLFIQYGYNKDDRFWIFDVKAIDKYYYSSKTAFNDYNYLELGPYVPYPNTLQFLFNMTFITPFHVDSSAISRWNIIKLYDNEFQIKLHFNTDLFIISLHKIAI